MPSLSGTHSYVRKNGVFALQAIHRELDHLTPVAAEFMGAFLAAETDSACEHNASVFVAHALMEKAVEYILGIGSMTQSLQISIIGEIPRAIRHRLSTSPPATNLSEGRQTLGWCEFYGPTQAANELTDWPPTL